MIRLHDTLLAIDGVPVQNLQLSHVTHMLAGPVGVEVRVTLSRTVLSGTSRYTVRFARLAAKPDLTPRRQADQVLAAASGTEEENEAARRVEAAAESLATSHMQSTVYLRFVKSWRDETSRQVVVRNTCVTMLLQECRAKARTRALYAWCMLMKSKRISRAKVARLHQLVLRLLQTSRQGEREAVAHLAANRRSNSREQRFLSTPREPEDQAGTQMSAGAGTLAMKTAAHAFLESSEAPAEQNVRIKEDLRAAERALAQAQAASESIAKDKEKLAAECDRLRMECQRLRVASSEATKEIAQMRLWKEQAEERERSFSEEQVAAQHEHARLVLMLQSERESREQAEKGHARELERQARSLQSQHHLCSACGNVQMLFVGDHDENSSGGRGGETARKLAKLCHCSCEARLQVSK
jgi:chromosome segregation ATPase